MSDRPHKTLVVFFDVSKFSKAEIERLLTDVMDEHHGFVKFEIIDEPFVDITAERKP